MGHKAHVEPWCRLEGLPRAARRVFVECLPARYPILKLHRIDKNGECSCGKWSDTRYRNKKERYEAWKTGVIPPCRQPGKHLMSSAKRSVMTSIDEIEFHMDCGGSIGICLRMEGVPAGPLRLVVFDCDREGAYEWLKQRGITSAMEVFGKRGVHVIAILPADCPDLQLLQELAA